MIGKIMQIDISYLMDKVPVVFNPTTHLLKNVKQ